jgi:TolA-binding protein
MQSRLLTAILMMTCGVACAAPVFAQGLPGAAVRTEGNAAPADRDAIKSRAQERCRDNPQQCEEMKAKLQARREQCKADPQKCREETKARREAWCKANPQRCEEVKARIKERREQCRADPTKCPPARGQRPDAK